LLLGPKLPLAHFSSSHSAQVNRPTWWSALTCGPVGQPLSRGSCLIYAHTSASLARGTIWSATHLACWRTKVAENWDPDVSSSSQQTRRAWRRRAEIHGLSGRGLSGSLDLPRVYKAMTVPRLSSQLPPRLHRASLRCTMRIERESGGAASRVSVDDEIWVPARISRGWSGPVVAGRRSNQREFSWGPG
jgi:hypothetical protein